MVDQLVEEGKLQIKLAFPDKIKDIDEIENGKRTRMTFLLEDAISMVEIARTLDLPDFYFRALYHCCQLPPTKLVNGITNEAGFVERLSSEDLIKCISGRHVLTLVDLQICRSLFQDPGPDHHDAVPCTSQSRACLQECLKVTVDHVSHNPLNDFSPAIEEICQERGICRSCITFFQARHARSRQTILESLGQCFEL